MRFFWRPPSQVLLDTISGELAEEDLGELERPTGEDHKLHVAGKVCVYCGKVISAGQPARLVGENDFVHDYCHKPRS